MIPIRLSLEGIYSYQQKQEIDFQYLTSAELFGIFGATGSGKSSILEAIGFAIYDQTERLNKREPGGLAYNMMNLKSDRLAINFECWAGERNETKYRFAVENRRKKKNFEKTDSFKRQTYRWEGDQWLPVEAAPETIIGLSYDNFRRCVIIPQGKFEEFLGLGAADRTRMLQDLFHLDKYDLKDPIGKLNQKNKLAIENTQGSLATYSAVTEDVIAENKALIANLESQRKTQEEALKENQRAFESAQQLRELFDQLTAAKKRQQELEAEKPGYESRRKQLDRYQQAQVAFATTLTEFDRLSKSLAETEKSVQQKRQTYEQGEQEVAKKEAAFVHTEKTFQTRDELLKKADELEKVLALQKRTAVIMNRQERVKNGSIQINEAQEQESSLSQTLEQLEKEIQKLESDQPDLTRIMAVKEWFLEEKRFQEQLSREQQSKSKILNQIEQGRQTKVAITSRIGIDIAKHDLSILKLIEQITAQKSELDSRRKKLDSEREQEEVQQRLKELAGNLQPGDPCPLCGSTDHVASSHEAGRNQQLVQLRQDISEIDRHIDEINIHLPSLERLLVDAKTLGAELKTTEATVQDIQESIDRHKSTFIWSEFEQDGIEKIEQLLTSGATLNSVLQDKKQERGTALDSLKRTRTNLGSLRPALEALRRELDTETGAYQEGVKDLKLVNFEEEGSRDSAMIVQEINELKHNYEGIGALHQSMKREIEERKSRLATLKGEISTLQSQRSDQATEVARLSQKLDQLIANSAFDSREDIRQTLALALDLEAEKDELRRFEREETQTLTTLEDLDKQVGERKFDTDAFEKLEEDIQEMEKLLKLLGQEIGGKQQYGQRLAKDLILKNELAQKLEGLEHRADNLRILEGLFRGNGFVNYISTVYLENLCAAANERFLRLTANSLSLEIDADNNFLVRDLLNAGKTRSVKTLSGGQTFQAALCLALALSDQVQRQAAAKQNFFFLDEGFGSQDKNSLRTIFQTLKSLRTENRIVGVISHVEELQQEIETHLRIVNDSETGSVVHESWTA